MAVGAPGHPVQPLVALLGRWRCCVVGRGGWQRGTGLQAGQLAGPIEIRGGFSIVALIDKRQVLTADPRDAVLSLKQISISFAKGTAEKYAAAKAANFAQVVKEIKEQVVNGHTEPMRTDLDRVIVALDNLAKDVTGLRRDLADEETRRRDHIAELRDEVNRKLSAIKRAS